ncbi:MAG: FAD-dependent monooxygenase [Myxococcota bacterium]
MTRVAIVGGGPAGSSFALRLLEAGVSPGDITIFDRANFPRPKLCGGALTARGGEELAALGVEPCATTRTLEFRSALGRFRVRERGPQWLFDRAELDNRLLRRCQDEGIRVREGCAIQRIEGGPPWRLVWNGGSESADWLVGADGARGVVGRALGLGDTRVGRLVEAYYEGGPLRRDVLYFDFDPILDGIPGYAWIFPTPDSDRWKIGVMDGRGMAPGRDLRVWTDAFAERNGFRRVDAKIAGWPERYFSPSTVAHRKGVLLTGEAWGIDPLLGEGIAPALEMSRYAAPRLKRALKSQVIPNYEADFLRDPAGRNLRFQYRLANLLYGPSHRRWMRVFFGHRHMKALAARGTEAYGRLEHHTWKLAGSYLLQTLRDGLPSNAPILRSEGRFSA